MLFESKRGIQHQNRIDYLTYIVGLQVTKNKLNLKKMFEELDPLKTGRVRAEDLVNCMLYKGNIIIMPEDLEVLANEFKKQPGKDEHPDDYEISGNIDHHEFTRSLLYKVEMTKTPFYVTTQGFYSLMYFNLVQLYQSSRDTITRVYLNNNDKGIDSFDSF